jgi:hypothetical protein
MCNCEITVDVEVRAMTGFTRPKYKGDKDKRLKKAASVLWLCRYPPGSSRMDVLLASTN